MKHIFISILFLFTWIIRLSAQDEYESCSFVAEEAWGGDTTAMKKFLTSCGKIDTVNFNEQNKPDNQKPHHQTISMRLNNGKIFRTDSIYFVADQMPEFEGQNKGLFQYLSSNIKYPPAARDKKIQGSVFVTFIIERDGSVSNAKVIRGIGGGCEEESLRVVRQMPKWKPGKMHGNPVKVQYTLPVKFALNK